MPRYLACSLLAVLLTAGCGQETPPAAPSSPESSEAAGSADVDLGSPAVPEPSTASASSSPDSTPAASPTTPVQAPVPTPPTHVTGSAASAQAGGVDLSHISETGALALVVRPAKAMSSPLVQGVLREIEQASPDFKLTEKMDQMRQSVGVDLNDVDYVLVVLDQQHLQLLPMLPMMMMGSPMPDSRRAVPDAIEPPAPNCDDEPPAAGEPAAPSDFAGPGAGNALTFAPPTLVVKFTRPVDQPDVQAKIASVGEKPAEQRTHSGKSYYYKSGDSSALWFQDATTAVSGDESRIKALIDGQAGAAGPLGAIMAPMADRCVAFALDVRPLHGLIGQLAQQNPAMAMIGGIVKQVNTLTLAADLEGPNLLQVQLHALNEGSANGLQGMLGGLLQQGQATFAQQLQANTDTLTDAQRALLPLVGQAVNKTTVTAAGAVCSVTMPRPEGLEELPTLLRPVLAEVKEQAAAARSMNDLRQIAISFHNYHDVYGGFPANGGPSEPGAPGAGLSWRVHLLPFLEQSALYQQFHLDEPWDSEHNKTLISKMPKLFGTHPEGKTSIHVFTGEGTPFNGEKGVKISEVTDGTSNTLLFVRAGENTAEVWTKPGGLAFDPASPLAALGDIADRFQVALMDGSVRTLTNTIDPETFKNLVQYADGNPLNLP